MGGAEVRIRRFNGGTGGGIFSAGVSDIGHTDGTTGTVSQQVIFYGGSNVTLSQSINLQSATITIDGLAQSVQPSMSAGVSTDGNTVGTTGVVSNQLVFVGGNNVSLSQSINGQSATLTINGLAQSAQPDKYNMIAAGSQTANTTGTVLFQNSNSISFGMSNSSVITAQYDLKSHDSVYHTGTIGAESQIVFDTLSGHDHDGTDSKYIITPQYFEVSKTAVGQSGKKYQSIAVALTAIIGLGDASATKPYVIRVYPGLYVEPPFTLIPYVSIVGTSMFDVVIQTNNNAADFISGVGHSYLRNCSVIGPTGFQCAAIIDTEENPAGPIPFVVQDVLIQAGYYGIHAHSIVNECLIHMLNVANWYVGASSVMHTFAFATGKGIIVGMNSGYMCEVADSITRGFAADGVDAELYLDVCYFRSTAGINVIDGLFLDNGASVRMSACTFTRGTNAIHIGTNGTGGFLTASACIIRNDASHFFTKDIWIENFGTIFFNGIATKTKIFVDIPANPTFSASFTDQTTGDEANVVIGELWLGADVASSIPLRDYGLTSYSSGWRSGGAVTRSGAPPSLNVSVAAGSGYINIGTGVTRITWGPGATVKLCVANQSQWIYVDNAGVVTVSAVEPTYSTVIMLAVVRTNTNHVVYLSEHRISLHQDVLATYDYIEKVFGPVSIENCIVTKNANPSLKVDFSGGKYFAGLEESQPGALAPVTFTYWYRKVGSSGWNSTTPGGGGSNFDTGFYDDNSGTLAALPGGKYKKDLLFVVKNDVGTEFHVVYGQVACDTVDQANAESGFEVPAVFESNALKIAGIVVLSGDTDISTIVNEKEKFVSEHNELLELQGGDAVASQYYHLNYGEWTSRNDKIVASLLGNTAGVMALVSTGTMYLAGGNNVTLSQNGQSITISGANVAIAAGGVTTTGSTFTFGNTSGISFLLSNGSIIGSVGAYLTSQSAGALSGSNTSFTYQTATFGNSNGMSFYVTNGSMVGSYTVPVQSAQTNSIIREVSLSGANTAGVLADITSGTMYLAGGNNITISQNGNSLTFSGPNALGAQTGISSIGVVGSESTFTSGNVVFSGLTNITINTTSAGANQYIRISGNDVTQFQNTSANTKFVQEWSLEGANTAGTVSSAQGSRLYLSGGNIVTLSGNSNTIVLSVNTASLLGTGAAASFRYTSDNGQLQYTSANTKFVQAYELEGVQTAGTTSILEGSQLYLSGGNMMTLSGNSNTIVFSVNTDSLVGTGALASFRYTSDNGQLQYTSANTKFVQAYELEGVQTAGTTSILEGSQLYLSGGNMMTLSGNSNTIIFSVNTNSLLGTGAAASFQYTSDNNLSLGTGATASFRFTSDNNQLQYTSANTKFIQEWSLEGANTAGTVSSAQGSRLYLSGGNIVTLSGNSNTIVLSVNTASLLGTGAAASFRYTSDNGQLQYTSANTKFVQGWELEGVQTAGTTSSSQGTQLYLSGGNMITLSGNSNTIVISAAGIGGIANSQTTFLGSTVNLLEGGGALTIASSAGGQSLKFSVPAQSSLVASGNVSIATGGNTVTISGMGIGSVGVVGSESTYTSGDVIFSGQANITLNTSITGGSQYIRISAGAGSGVGAIGNIANSNAFTSGSVIFSAQSNITINTSSDGVSQYIQISGLDAAAAAGVSAIANSEVVYTSGKVVFSEYSNITISSTISGGSQYFRFSVVDPGGNAIRAISGSNASISDSTVTFGSSNNMHFYVTNGSMVGSFSESTHSHPYINTSDSSKFVQGYELEGVQTAGTTSILEGTQLYLSGGNMMTLSGNSNTIVFSVNTDSLVGTGALASFQYTSANTKFVQGWELEGVQTAGTTSSSQGTQLYLSGGNMITLSGNSNTIVLSVNTASLVGTGALASFEYTTHTSVFQQTSDSSRYVQGWELEGVQTAGTTSSSQGSQLYLSGGNMMTLSGNSNTIVLSVNTASLLGTGAAASFQYTSDNNLSLGTGATASFRFTSDNGQLQFTSANTKFVQAYELEGVNTAGTTSILEGSQLYLSGDNMMTISGNSNTIIFSVNTASLVGTGALASLRYTSADGNLQFTSANTKFVQGWELEGVQTAGTTSSSQGTQLYLSGGNMITLSGNSNTIVLSVNTASLVGTGALASFQYTSDNNLSLGTGATASFRFTSDNGQLQYTSANTKFVQGWELEGINTSGTTSSSQGTQLYLSGGNNITLSGNSNTIVISAGAGGGGVAISNSQSLYSSGTLNLLEGGGAVTIAAGAQSLKISVPAQTNLVGAGNITLSSSGSTISISGMGIAGIVGDAFATTFSSGSVIFSGYSNITINTYATSDSQYIQISAPNPGAGGGIAIEVSNATQSSTVSAGSVLFQTGNGITFGLNGSTMTASHNALTSQSTAPSGLYVNAIATTFTSGNINFTGSNNITVSTGAQQIIISGPATHAVQTGISAIAATDVTYTAGSVSFYGSGLASVSSASASTGQGIVVNVAGVAQVNGSSNTVSIAAHTSAGNPIQISNNASNIYVLLQLTSGTSVTPVSSANAVGTGVSYYARYDHAHAGICCMGVSNTGTTLGDTGTKQGTIVIAGSGNVTVSQSSGAGINTIWISVPAGGGGVAAQMGGNTTGASAIITSGTLTLAGGNNITMSQAAGGNALTISGPNIITQVNFWENERARPQTILTVDTGGSFAIQRIRIPYNMTATQIDMLGNLTGTSNLGAGTFNMSVVLYTFAASTANSVSSTLMQSTLNASGQTASLYGTRWRTGSLNNWAITPGDYLIGFLASQSGGFSASYGGAHGVTNASNFSGAGAYTRYFYDCVIATAATKAAIQLSEINLTNASAQRRAFWFNLIGTF